MRTPQWRRAHERGTRHVARDGRIWPPAHRLPGPEIRQMRHYSRKAPNLAFGRDTTRGFPTYFERDGQIQTKFQTNVPPRAIIQ